MARFEIEIVDLATLGWTAHLTGPGRGHDLHIAERDLAGFDEAVAQLREIIAADLAPRPRDPEPARAVVEIPELPADRRLTREERGRHKQAMTDTLAGRRPIGKTQARAMREVADEAALAALSPASRQAALDYAAEAAQRRP